MIFLHVLQPVQIVRAFHNEETRAAPSHKDLADFFFDGKMAKGFLGPLVASGGIQGSGAQLLVFREHGQAKCQSKKYGEEDSRDAGVIAEEQFLAVRSWVLAFQGAEPNGDWTLLIKPLRR